MRIRAYFCKNPKKLKKEPPVEVYVNFAGDTHQECLDKAAKYAEEHKYELTGHDVYL